MAHRSFTTDAIRLACVWIARVTTASLCSYWIVLKGGILFGLFPALAALFGLSRQWLTGRTEMAVWRELSARARRDFVAANLAGWTASLPIAAAAALAAGSDRLPIAAVALFVVGLAILPVAMALAAWVSLPWRQIPFAPLLLAAAAPGPTVLAFLATSSAAALWLIHPLVAIYVAPALAALTASAALLPLLSSPLLSLSDPPPTA